MAKQSDQQDHHHSDPHACECNGAALFKPDHSIDSLNLSLAASVGGIRLLTRFNGIKPIKLTSESGPTIGDGHQDRRVSDRNAAF
jgi:hypothetical protein